MHDAWLMEIVAAQKRGEARGIASICSANPLVLAAAFNQAREKEMPLLIESTCNQVNQEGGYTGLRPAAFMSGLEQMAEANGFPRHRLVVGGDHLGPSPWQHEAAERAMEKASQLVFDYVSAGYGKIHLDASMKCADDEAARPLPKEVAAQRSAQLARVAEAAQAKRPAAAAAPLYVIGTEVPRPGGALLEEAPLAVTTAEDVQETIEITRQAFQQQGVGSAWERVIAVVVQPGVEFGDDSLDEYDRTKAQHLARFIEQQPRLLYEAHSTDYQTPAALRQMVEDHFAILKVGPALTFALREGLFALAQIEAELLAETPGAEPSRLSEVLETVMEENPAHWRHHYRGSPAEQRLARKYSYSDRIRYYWSLPAVQTALHRLWANLTTISIPMTLLSQYLPVQYWQIRSGQLANSPQAIVQDKVRQVLADYAFACGYQREHAAKVDGR